MHAEAALASGVAAGLLGLLVPPLIRSLPEPEHDESAPDEDPKPLYVDVASRRGLWWRSALAAAAAGALVGAVSGWDWWLLVLVPLVPVSVALAVIDWATKLLPKRIVLPATAYALVGGLAGWAVTRDHDELLRAAIALVAVRSIFWVLWFIHSAGLGFGDVRLSALLGFALGHVGTAEIVVAIYAAYFLFAVPALVLAVVRRDRSVLKRAVPFGPFLLVGGLVGLVAGPALAGLVVSG